MKNWKTTLGGMLAAIGTTMQASESSNLKLAGAVIGAIGLAILGWGAKDNNVTGGTIAQ